MAEDGPISFDTPSALRTRFVEIGGRMKRLVVGKDRAVDHLLIALLTGGHVLLEGAPGLAKTRLARLLAQAVEGDYRRIQFTPDLMPSDLIGGAIYNAQSHSFEFQRGPIFANFILADEINRAPAKVQSALLEAMEERQVTSGEATHRLEFPFFVVATQNPIEHEGTWDLPQAQLDRFVMQILIDYPDAEVERRILDLAMDEAASGQPADASQACIAPISRTELQAAQAEVAGVHLSELVRDYLVRLIAASRDDPAPVAGVGEHLSHPISPRGTIMLARAAQARAWLADRDYVVPEDVVELAPDVLRHRIGLSYRAEADGIPLGGIIATLIAAVDVV